MVKPTKRITLEQYQRTARKVLRDAQDLQPTAILNDAGKVIMTVGLDERKLFPLPDADLLADVEGIE